MLLLGAALAAWLLRGRLLEARFHWSRFASSFVDLDWKWVLAASAVALLTYFGRALRWAVMLKPVHPHPNLWGLTKATLIGFTALVLLGRPGEFVRPYLIALKQRVPFSSQLAAWFLERIWDLLAVLLVFGWALTEVRASRAALGPGFRWVLETGGYVLGILSALCLLTLVMLSQFSGTMRRRLLDGLRFLPAHQHSRAERFITAFLDGTAATKTLGSLLALLFYTLLEWALITLCLVLLFRAYPEGARLGVRDLLIFMGFVAFGSVLQIPGIGGGVQIVSIVVLTQLFGLPVEVATSQAILLWCVTLVVVVPPGLALAFHEGINWRRLRELETEAADRARDASQAIDVSGEKLP